MAGKLTDRLLEMSSASSSSSRNLVKEAFDELMTGNSEEAGVKLAALSDEQMNELRDELSKHGQGPEMETHGTVENPKPEVGEVVPEEKSRTEARSAKQKVDVALGKGLGVGDGSGSHPAGTSPTISDLLSPKIDETERTPDGGGDTDSDLKKKADFEAGWTEGIKDGVDELTGLVSKHASLDIRARFGKTFDKIASEIGEEEAIVLLQESFADGQKIAMQELANKEEVKMGSLKKLAEDQEKIASADDLREFGRKLGREAILTKIAQDQMEEVAPEEVVPEGAPEEVGGEAEIAEAAEASQIIDAIAEKALTDPGSLSPEEAEVLLEVGDAIEDAEGEIVGDAEKITTIVQIAAHLRKFGYGE